MLDQIQRLMMGSELLTYALLIPLGVLWLRLNITLVLCTAEYVVEFIAEFWWKMKRQYASNDTAENSESTS